MVALTVLLPVRDGETSLDQAISSIRRQTFADFELSEVRIMRRPKRERSPQTENSIEATTTP